MKQDQSEDRYRFPFERLEVWHHAVDLADSTLTLMESSPPKTSSLLTGLMEEAVFRVAGHIAAGKGRQNRQDFIQSLHLAEASLFEVVSLLHIMTRRGAVQQQETTGIVQQAEIIDRKLHGLINSLRSRK